MRSDKRENDLKLKRREQIIFTLVITVEAGIIRAKEMLNMMQTCMVKMTKYAPVSTKTFKICTYMHKEMCVRLKKNYIRTLICLMLRSIYF